MQQTIEKLPPSPPEPPDHRRRLTTGLLVALAVAAVAIVGLVVALVIAAGDDDDDADVTAQSTTTSVAEEPSTTEGSTTPATSTTTASTAPAGGAGVVTDAEAASIVFPDPATGGYVDPGELAADFADLLGFSDALVGEYQAGDARSGEVELRPLADGPVTTVGVRRMSDDHHYVVFAATSEVELTAPTAGSAIDHPLLVEGRGRGFEGQIRISVFGRETGDELGAGFVTAGGVGELEPFVGEIPWDNPGGGWGLVVASVIGGPESTTWAATALPVGFIGGD